MKLLKYGSRGAQVQMLQTALKRAGFDPGAADGIFGHATQKALRCFQNSAGLRPDGVAGPLTHAALRPYLTGYTMYTVDYGDSLYRIAARFGVPLRAVEAANPEADPLNLQPGQQLTVPLPFAVVPEDIDWCSELVSLCCEGLAARYPFISRGSVGQSVLKRPIELLRMGSGRRVLYNAAHHANEWITVPLLLRFAEELASAAAFGGRVYGYDAGELLENTELALIPCVNPDGLDLVAGDLCSGAAYERAREIAGTFPEIPFPSGWKANIGGVDLNLQYPAGWEQAREIKFSQGFNQPAPRDYVGQAPLTAPESRAMYDFTRSYSPALTLSYHTQGAVIFWKYLDMEPLGALEIARRFGLASGYAVSDTPYASGYAGYKDWYIQDFNRPGYTIEAGVGENPLPIGQLGQIYRDNLGILALGMALA